MGVPRLCVFNASKVPFVYLKLRVGTKTSLKHINKRDFFPGEDET